MSDDAIHVEIDPHATLPERYLGADEDGPRYGPMSLYDAIICEAAHRLVEDAKKDGLKEDYRSLTEHVRQLRDEEIRAAVAPEIEAALSKPLRKTNQYGEATGADTTLREMIGEEVRKQLAAPADRYDRKETVLQRVIKEEVDRALTDELKTALAAGKSEVLAAVRKRGTEVIEEAVRKALPL